MVVWHDTTTDQQVSALHQGGKKVIKSFPEDGISVLGESAMCYNKEVCINNINFILHGTFTLEVRKYLGLNGW